MKIILAFLSVIILSTACSISVDVQETTQPVKKEAEPDRQPKNIVFLIGDGMGLPQITMGMYSQDRSISMERFSVVGLHKSHSYDDLITDSAAGATAFACGQKTYNGAIAVDPDTAALKTILEYCEDRGMATGLVATSSIVHATPASFATHNKYRKNYEEIALDYVDAGVDVMIGGGKKYFDRREDERNLLEDFASQGYKVSHYAEAEIDELEVEEGKGFFYLTADGEPLPAAQGRDYLETAVEKTLDALSKKSDEGFFLMIEGSQIDWGGHANNRDYVLSEFEDFDRAVHKVLDWAQKDENTLVVLTADHETGGLTLNIGSTRDSIAAAFTTGKHTATMIPVFAEGPGAEAFSGIYQNTEIFYKMKKALKL